MKQMIYILLLITAGTLCSCSTSRMDQTEPRQVFDEFWTWVDENYIYFEEKAVDWDSVYQVYAEDVELIGTDEELFALMEQALLTLKDSHNRLESPFRRAKTHPFTEGYEVHFSDALVSERYLSDSLGSQGNLSWGLLQDSIGYIYLSDFTRYSAFRSVMEDMASREVSKLIVDVRSNGGGDSNAVPALLSVLVEEETLLGSYIEKSGPARDHVTAPIAERAYPDPDFHFSIPVVVLINRGSYSATSYFAAMIKGLPGVTIMGQRTGGGGGGNLGYQLSNGWLVAVSVSDFLDKEGQSIEPGVLPDVWVENTAADITAGRDRMLERAIGQ